MARFGQRGRRRTAVAALAGAAVLALAGCAAAQPEAAPLGGPEPASAAGAMASAEPANPVSPAASGASAGSVSPADSGASAGRDQAARSSSADGPADPDQAVSSTDSANPGSRVTIVGPADQPPCPHGSAFILTLPSDYHGWASPVEAARQFSRQSNPSGYGTPDTVWTASTPDASGVTLTAPDLMLQAVRLPNGRWAIISGQRCD